MTRSRNKLVLGAISIISLIAALYHLLNLSAKIDITSQFYPNLVVTVMTGLNVAILFAWFAFEASGGIPVTILVIMIVLWFNLKIGVALYHAVILPFFVTAFIGYRCWKDKLRMDQAHALKSEKLDEELNLLYHDIEQKKKYIKSLEEKLSGYSVLKQVTESLSTVLSMDDITSLIVDQTLRILGKPGRALLFLVDMEKQELMLSLSRDTQNIGLKVKTKNGDFFDHWVLKYRKSLMIDDITKDFRFPADSVEEAKVDFRSMISVPLIAENRIIGILRMDNIKEFAYTQDDLRLLDIMSDLGAVAIENALLYSKTQELAIRDGLTGLYLKRYFMGRFNEETKRAARKKGMLSLLMLDIDHFKNYNDQYGHIAGDLVLKHLARKVVSMTKETDIVARYGGEEIIMLLFGIDKSEADKEAQAIRKHIEDEPFILRREKLRLTVSIGVSSYPEDGALAGELIKIADERLYKAKAKGRNRVCAD